MSMGNQLESVLWNFYMNSGKDLEDMTVKDFPNVKTTNEDGSVDIMGIGEIKEGINKYDTLLKSLLNKVGDGVSEDGKFGCLNCGLVKGCHDSTEGVSCNSCKACESDVVVPLDSVDEDDVREILNDVMLLSRCDVTMYWGQGERA